MVTDIPAIKPLKALTIWQPWASLIMAGAKPYEFRGWRFPSFMIGNRIVCHAGARPMREAEILDLIKRLEGDEAWSTGLIADKAMPVLHDALADVRRPKAPKRGAPDLFAAPTEPTSVIGPPNLPIAAGLGTFTLGTPRNGNDIAREMGMPINDSDRDSEANWGWPCRELTPWFEPLPMKGAQGFWNWPTPESVGL